MIKMETRRRILAFIAEHILHVRPLMEVRYVYPGDAQRRVITLRSMKKIGDYEIVRSHIPEYLMRLTLDGALGLLWDEIRQHVKVTRYRSVKDVAEVYECELQVVVPMQEEKNDKG